jgi:hypothetical protein
VVDVSTVAEIGIVGLSTGFRLALLGAGITLVFGLGEVLNLSQGIFAVVTAVIALEMMGSGPLLGLGLPLPVALIVALAGIALVALLSAAQLVALVAYIASSPPVAARLGLPTEREAHLSNVTTAELALWCAVMDFGCWVAAVGILALAFSCLKDLGSEFSPTSGAALAHGSGWSLLRLSAHAHADSSLSVTRCR